MAINDVLPLKAARRDAIANFKRFGASNTRDLILMVTPYSARISAIYFLPFGNVWLGSVSVCNAWEAQCRIYEGWLELWSYFKPFVDQSSRNCQTM